MQSQRAILDAIRRIVRSLRVSSREAERDLGLSGAQLFVLQVLKSARSPLSINEIAEATHTHQSSVSTVVSKLADQELVERRPSKDDARKMEISLTSLGQKKLKTAPRMAQERILQAIDKLSGAEQKRLAELLERVTELAGLAEEPATLFFEEENRKSP